MVQLTMISRVHDGLLLAASMQDTEQSNRNFQEYHSQAKQLFRKLGEHSPSRCSLEAGAMTFHYLISQGVCYLTLCEASYSKKLAFSFLEELQAEFWELYGKKVSSVSRPYAFIEFVFFSSLTSLQAEEFFDMVAKVQARRYNDQRADFTEPEGTGTEKSGVCEEQLYNTILAHQSQRLEDQRTEPPIPVGVQDLLDLLIRAQGTRMEDQRSALPPSLTAPSLLRRPPSFLHSV